MTDIYDCAIPYDLWSEEDKFTEKNRTRAKRRKTDIKKALRKRNISRHALGGDWYHNLHQYSKNKIHCSCNLCRFRPNWNPDAVPMQDVRNTMKMDTRLYEYEHMQPETD